MATHLNAVPSPAHQPNACSFCGKVQTEVAQLIAGPAVFICDECTDLCAQIVAETRANKGRASRRS